MTQKKLELFFSSPMEYEELTLEVQLDRERIIEVNQDKGVNHLEAELFGTDHAHGFIAKMPLDDLINILIEARETLRNQNQ
ncbi:hypothetical protein MUA02_00260 [Enterobacteriaceae bacterium H20N1]|uniref:Uncharacterized protein n=1 Tax=Dryocola boscaweniae TaxID=2925397 RepID=A0A9X2W3Y4_9ENTR|nr:hypothetical protein [Dryocola boscaweniae]MCT4700285.1 hypothetical protein [Dryocola boscaweniae]MCT4714506.1 hypothetical protein [Dryocola boscaweniae]MCT4717513.1 hypothetical protein [Dryocola boscaweniae]